MLTQWSETNVMRKLKKKISVLWGAFEDILAVN